MENKKQVTYRLSQQSLQQLEDVALALGWDRTAVLERLVEKYAATLAVSEAKRIAEATARYR
jgi:hypothetical protein